jgi:hypothetical protein
MIISMKKGTANCHLNETKINLRRVLHIQGHLQTNGVPTSSSKLTVEEQMEHRFISVNLAEDTSICGQILVLTPKGLSVIKLIL